MTSRELRRFTAPAILASLLALGACAEPEPPTATIRSAKDAVARAEENGAQALAPQILAEAQAKLNRAQTAVKNKDMRTAGYLAEEAEVDAELAGSSANAQRVGNTALELEGAQKQR